ncbi:hypothetical protein LX87_04401 [Larkinella arboricola]|uniref:BNR repeat protein n=1 Tax=Larkinella arboricola TaxID=643671 RepID=A0A327WQN0_LARAB|nr:hypothetical protein [Larkinella arboricola]RAJ94514.1 hypothetical protein LX87_04401 [Larkinella arboricola]
MKVGKYILLWLGLACITAAHAQENSEIEVTKIWDKSPHDAFPDLIKFKDYYYCTLREATNHVGNESDGKVRVIRSKDGVKWESVKLFESSTEDVREARLSVRPDGTLMAIVAAGKFRDGRYWTLTPYASFSDKAGENFTPLQKVTYGSGITPTLDWIWRVTWHKGVGYGVMYSIKYTDVNGKWKRDMFAQVLKTKDGRKFEKVADLSVDGSPNEATIRFDKNDKMFIVLRRETEDQMGVLYTSLPPYKNWSYDKLTVRLGGPNFLFLDKNQLVLGTRFHEGKQASTALHLLDLKGNIKKTIKLPSNGDSSYPGLVLEKDKLLVTYYSSHEGKSSIYFAKVPLNQISTTN